MRHQRHYCLLGLLTILCSGAWAQRIVVLSPDVAEIVVALGAANEVVGKDQFDPLPALAKVPVVSLHRSVTSESVLSVKPDVVLGSWMVQPPSVFAQLKKIGIKAENVAPQEDMETYARSIRTIGRLLGKQSQANSMASQWQHHMNALPPTGKRYILSYDGRIVAGRGTVADRLIKLAGGINAANVDGLKPLSREGWLAAKPDVILVAEHHSKLLGGSRGFATRPEVAASTAAKNSKIAFWPANDYLRYSLNTPQTVKKLHELAK